MAVQCLSPDRCYIPLTFVHQVDDSSTEKACYRKDIRLQGEIFENNATECSTNQGAILFERFLLKKDLLPNVFLFQLNNVIVGQVTFLIILGLSN